MASRFKSSAVLLTAGELEVADVFVQGKPAELHPFANHRHVTPENKKKQKSVLTSDHHQTFAVFVLTFLIYILFSKYTFLRTFYTHFIYIFISFVFVGSF